jgi:dephospho-CoA kinase
LATGKSIIGEELRRLGCHLIRADDLGHAVLAPGGEAYDAVIAEFGEGILKEDGAIDRRRLGQIVFSDSERLARLNSLVHPAVFSRQRRLLDEIAQSDPQGIAVVEAAIMYETGSHRNYRKMIVAVCSEEQQIARAAARDGMSPEDARNRIRRQMPLAEKARLADYVVDTSGTIGETLARARVIYEELALLAHGVN